ncbi:MAG TPA: prephenate dehydrogenase/arogenate dehydrogenase family protein [Sporomusaceae bacterium]|nr:prephenate dehydrogenase/arogenate dehydrogenase family protein [Sporomusaceae bacterium]
MRRIAAVIGLGLIGGSLALALKKHTDFTVIGYDACQQTRQLAEKSGELDGIADSLQTGVAEADIVFLAIPPGAIGQTVQQAAGHLKAGAVVTDVASTKGELLRIVPQLLPPGVCYVGGHPMAGSEKTGFIAANAQLFCGRPYIITRHQGVSESALAQLSAIAEQIGALPVVLEGEQHDPAVAHVSHTPYVTAAALTVLAGQGEQGQLHLALAAGGFRDMTRIASSNPSLWADICLTNKVEIKQTIARLKDILDTVESKLANGDRAGLTEFFQQAKQMRDACQSN